MSCKEKVVIVGGGLSGSLLSIYLAKRGYQVEVFERRSDIRKGGAVSGRSINMALSTRGLLALEQVGMAEKILQKSIPMKGRMIHSGERVLRFAPYGKNDQEVIYSISRNDLNAILIEEAEKNSLVNFHFRSCCLGLDLEKDQLNFSGCRQEELSLDEIAFAIDTEGAASAIRPALLTLPGFNYSQHYLEHYYKELEIPSGEGGSFLMEKHALHIWPKGSYMLIALPNLDGSFTCTLFLPLQGPQSFSRLKSEKDVHAFFREQFPDALSLMPKLSDHFFHNPTSHLATIKCYPWNYRNKILLLGDAAHAIVPFYGQGMNCSFEDCRIFDSCLEEHRDNWEAVFNSFQKKRKVETDAIADLALDNFVEMRDAVSDPKFLLKKELEHLLEEKFPNEFTSKYSMVTFSHTPYSIAMKKGRIQDEVIKKVCLDVDHIDELNLFEVKKQLDKALM